MEELFLSFWNRGVSAGWLILAVAVLRLVLRKAPKSIRCLLWLLVGIRLSCPFSIQSAASLIPSAETIPQAVLEQNCPQINSGLAVINGPVNEYLSGHIYEGITRPVGYTRSITSLCAVIWLAGAAVLILWALADWLRLQRRVAEAVPDGEGVWLCERIASPFLLGIFRPRIYLPFGLDEDVRTYVVAHEKAHLNRFDHLIKPAGFLLLAVYWFQPLVWLAYFLLCRDIELACDELVIRQLGAKCKKPYSEALLQFGRIESGAAVCPLAFGVAGVKERVKNVLNYRKPAFWVVAVSLAACVIAAVCFLTDPVTPDALESNLRGNVSDNLVDNLSVFYNTAPKNDTYVCGALVYQSPFLSSYFPDGSSLGVVSKWGDMLATADGSFKRVKTHTYSPEEFLALLDAEGPETAALLPQDTKCVIWKTYQNENVPKEYSFHIWEAVSTSGDTRLWAGDVSRLYALIDLEQALPFSANGVLWTYDPSASTCIPIRFDLEGPVTVTALSGALSRSIKGDWTAELTATHGETIYWQPSQDGCPQDGAALEYRWLGKAYHWDGQVEENIEWLDTLELRPVMDYESIYGSKTYGISNNWLGVASSTIHSSMLDTDMETGNLTISIFGDTPNEAGPYALRNFLNNVVVRGKSLP